MSNTSGFTLNTAERNNWIRLRTMIALRWVAIFGQIVAIAVAQRVYNLDLEYGLCYLAIGVSIVGNLVATFIYPENKRLSELENVLMVLFDQLQLSLLLYLTGGLNNPFAMLILGPVSISAAVVTLRSTLFLGVVAFIVVTILAQYNVPLRSQNGFTIQMPQIFVFGNWAALVIALVFLSVYSRRIAQEINTMSDALQATQFALSREQKLHDVGGVIAAAAHELGTPLATIKLASAELIEDLSDRPDLAEDAVLIHEQADRCRDILRSMGRAGKDDLHMRSAPLSAVLDEAAEPHLDRGKTIHFEESETTADMDLEQPMILRRPEVIHGLRNLIQNAVDFARDNVWVETSWTQDKISVRIVDDGRGFPVGLLGRIGDPFMRQRKAEQTSNERPGYEGMGLGLFIAKTLLERSGAELSFANGSSSMSRITRTKSGAIVQVDWPRASLDAKSQENWQPPRENRVNQTF